MVWTTITIAGLLSLNNVDQVYASEETDVEQNVTRGNGLEDNQDLVTGNQNTQTEESVQSKSVYELGKDEVSEQGFKLKESNSPNDLKVENAATDSGEEHDQVENKTETKTSKEFERESLEQERKEEINDQKSLVDDEQDDDQPVSKEDKSQQADHDPIAEEKAYVEANTPDPQPGFRVLPYLQKPSSTSMRISWVSELGSPAKIRLTTNGQEIDHQVIEPEYLEILEYTRAEVDENISHAGKALPQGEWLYSNSNYKYNVDFEKLKPNTEYTYTIEMDGIIYKNSFNTFPTKDDWEHIRLAAFSDTETEPKGELEQREWELHTTNPYTPESEPRPGEGSSFAEKHGASYRNDMFLVNYPIDQQTALNENLAHLAEANLDALLIAGDLTQGSGYQPAWDEFWRHFAGNFNDFASNVPLITALGNWETTAALSGGYGSPDDRSPVVRARNRYHAYITTPDYPGHEHHKSSYYRTDIGPITILTLDSTNGFPDEDVNQDMLTGGRYSGDDRVLNEEVWYKGKEYDPYITTDTQGSFTAEEYANAYAKVYPDKTPEESDLPAFNPGSLQWKWTIEQLQDAREAGQIIIVQFHHAPYSSGVHGSAPNFEHADNQSGVAMRVYSPLFEKYGVSLVISGHDEMFERSFVDLDGDGRGFHVYDVGVAADGLRGEQMVRDENGNLVPLNFNTYSQWSATANEPETWLTNENGVKHLVDGGLHYGHLQLDLVRTDYGAKMILQPVYLFPILDDEYNFVKTERRVYDDIVVMHFDHNGLEILDFEEEYTFKFINPTTKGITSYKASSIGEAKKYFEKYALDSGLGDMVWTYDPSSKIFTAVSEEVTGQLIADSNDEVYDFLVSTGNEVETSDNSVYNFIAPEINWNTDLAEPEELKNYTFIYIGQNTIGQNGATTYKATNPEVAEKYFRQWANENGLGDLDWSYEEESRTFTGREKVKEVTTIEGETSVDSVYDFMKPVFDWNIEESEYDKQKSKDSQEDLSQGKIENSYDHQERDELDSQFREISDHSEDNQTGLFRESTGEQYEQDKPNQEKAEIGIELDRTGDQNLTKNRYELNVTPTVQQNLGLKQSITSDFQQTNESKELNNEQSKTNPQILTSLEMKSTRTNKKDKFSNQTLPDTATGSWLVGLLGLVSVTTGIITWKGKKHNK